MPGPRAPMGMLSQHAANAAGLARNRVGSAFRSSQSRKNIDTDDEDSSSSSDSESLAGDDDEEDATAFLAKLKSTSAAKKNGLISTPAQKPDDSKQSGWKDPSLVKKGGSAKNGSQPAEDSDSSSDSTSDSEYESSSESSSADQTQVVAPEKAEPEDAVKSAKSEDSDESDSDSESESESEISAGQSPREPQKQTEPKPTMKSAVKAKETIKATSLPKKSTTGAFKSKEMVSSDSVSTSESDNDEPKPSGRDEGPGEEDSRPLAVEKRNGNTVVARLPEVVAHDFHLRKAVGNHGAGDIANFLKEAQKEGKQIWYFTAPESVPIEVIQEHAIPLDRVKNGQPLFTHSGDDYGVGFDTTTSTSIKVVIPNKDGTDYELLRGRVDQTIHLKRMTRFGQSGETSVAVTQSHTATVTPRSQPQGLKARYLPSGVSAQPASDEDTEMTQSPSLTATAATATLRNKAERKRKHRSTGDDTSSQHDTVQESAKKAKKARFSDSVQPPVKVTPIPTPAVPSLGGSNVSSSPLTQPTPGKKETKVPLPPQAARPMPKTPLSPELPASTPTQKSKKSTEKTKKHKLVQASPSGSDAPGKRTINDLKTPRKETPIPPPTPGNQA